MNEWQKLSKKLDIHMPQASFEKILPYVIKPPKENAEYGEFVLIGEDAPIEIKEEHQKYIKYLCKFILSYDIVQIREKCIIGISKEATGKEKEQAELIMQLIKQGVIDNNPFIKL